MQAPLPASSPDTWQSAFADARRFWEPRRILYNAILTLVVLAWLVFSWPHFRPAFHASSLLLLAILAFLANLSYSAAYLPDLILQCSGVAAAWKRLRWPLWIAGTLFAILLANYWIADEIYPFVH